MSALAQQDPYFAVPRRSISELDLLRAISNITWTADHAEFALTSIAAVALRLPGVVGFRFEPLEHRLHLPFHETPAPRPTGPTASALSTVSANGQSYGQLRIVFDPHSSLALESPVRLARFMGQQIGLLLHRLDQSREHQRHSANLKTIQRTIRRRKAIHRAAVILAAQRNVSEAQALSFMVGYARRHRRGLLEISEALVFGYDSYFSSSPSKAAQFHAR